MDLVLGRWESEVGSVVVEKNGRKWSITIILRQDGGDMVHVCAMQPEFRDGGFYGRCTGQEETLFRIKHTNRGEVYVETPTFDITAKRMDQQ